MNKLYNQTDSLLLNLCIFATIFYSANFTTRGKQQARSLSARSMEWVGHGQPDKYFCGAFSADFNHLAGRG